MKPRIIVDGKDIYLLEKTTPEIIEINKPVCVVSITDGFHYSKPFYISFEKKDHYRLKVSSILDNQRLFFILIITGLLFLLAFLNELWWMKFISFIPVLLGLYLYYIRRSAFFLLEAF